MTVNTAADIHYCLWPRHSLLVSDIHGTHHIEYMMGQMEYPNRTADPEEQLYKTSRL